MCTILEIPKLDTLVVYNQIIILKKKRQKLLMIQRL